MLYAAPGKLTLFPSGRDYPMRGVAGALDVRTEERYPVAHFWLGEHLELVDRLGIVRPYDGLMILATGRLVVPLNIVMFPLVGRLVELVVL